MSDFEMFRGDSAEFELTVTRDAAPVNLTGGQLRFSAKRSKDDPDSEAVVSKVSTDAAQIEITDAVNGLATVKMVPGDTEDLASQTLLFYDVQFKDAASRIFTLATGKLKVKLDVTQVT